MVYKVIVLVLYILYHDDQGNITDRVSSLSGLAFKIWPICVLL
jgi:hypothetical protein